MLYIFCCHLNCSGEAVEVYHYIVAAVLEIELAFESAVGGGRIFEHFSVHSQADDRAAGLGFDIRLGENVRNVQADNSINIGLPILECDEAAKDIKEGDTVSVNFDTGVITNETTGKTYQAEPFPEFIQNIIKKGGLINSIM